MSAATNDVTTVVLEQHKEVAQRLDAVLKATGSGRSVEFNSLATLLGVHEAAEESVIYPVLRKLGEEGTRVADERTHEEEAAKEILTKLKSFKANSQEFEALFAEFNSKVHAHAASEEAEVIPLLTSSISAEGRQSMGDAFRASQNS
jgi:hemerythrin superfamily protein